MSTEINMKIAVLGTGMVGRAFAARFAQLGHDVVVGTRNVEQTLARTEADFKGTPGYGQWAAQNPHTPLNTFAQASAHGEVVINATAGMQTLQALEDAGPETLAGKTVIDLALPLDYSKGRPPYLAFANNDSLGEQVQRLLPHSRVVKTLNTMPVTVMLDPKRLHGTHHVFLSGDDESAKGVVSGLLAELGWPVDSLVNLGGIETARATEMYANLLFRIANVSGTYDFNISIVRA